MLRWKTVQLNIFSLFFGEDSVWINEHEEVRSSSFSTRLSRNVFNLYCPKTQLSIDFHQVEYMTFWATFRMCCVWESWTGSAHTWPSLEGEEVFPRVVPRTWTELPNCWKANGCASSTGEPSMTLYQGSFLIGSLGRLVMKNWNKPWQSDLATLWKSLLLKPHTLWCLYISDACCAPGFCHRAQQSLNPSRCLQLMLSGQRGRPDTLSKIRL